MPIETPFNRFDLTQIVADVISVVALIWMAYFYWQFVKVYIPRKDDDEETE